MDIPSEVKFALLIQRAGKNIGNLQKRAFSTLDVTESPYCFVGRNKQWVRIRLDLTFFN